MSIFEKLDLNGLSKKEDYKPIRLGIGETICSEVNQEDEDFEILSLGSDESH